MNPSVNKSSLVNSPGFNPDETLAKPLPTESSEAIATSPLILLAEDNEANISMLLSYLTAKNYQTPLAYNGQEAIDLAKSHHPDLILMDIQMPGMDGLEAIRQIRMDTQLHAIPIIALTALAMEGDRQRCLDAGATEYLAKPVRLKALSQLMQTLLDS
jgi:CheY-like chemotaxis protein